MPKSSIASLTLCSANFLLRSLASVISVTICSSVTSIIRPGQSSTCGRCSRTISPTGSLTRHLTGTLIAIRRLTPNRDRFSPDLSALTSACSASVSTLASSAPGMKLPGSRTPCSRMADAREGLGAGELLAAQIDLGLVPELDPVVLERFGKRDLDSARRRAMAELELGHDLLNGRGLERLLEHRQHCSFICSPACLTVSSTAEPRLLISCTAPVKPALPSASID